MPEPSSLQDAIAAWLSATQAAPSAPTPDFSTRTTPADGLVDMANPAVPKVDWTMMAMEGLRRAHAAAPTLTSMGVRLGGAIGGGVLGSVGGPMGALAGAATGGSIGSELAQTLETGASNPVQSYVEGLTSMVPGGAFKPGAPILRQLPGLAARSVPANLAGSVGVQLAEGNGVSLPRTAKETAMGAMINTAIPVGVQGVKLAPQAIRRVAQSPAVQHLLADETGALGPLQPKVIPQPPDMGSGTALAPPPPEMAPVTPGSKKMRFRGPVGGKNPAHMAEDIERHAGMLKRLGQDDDAIAESVYFHSQVADDPMAQSQRGIVEPQRDTMAAGEAIRATGAFELPQGRASKMKFSVEDAAALQKEYAVREEFLTRLRTQIPPDLKTRFNSGDLEAAATVADLSAKYGVDGIDGLERLKQETALSAIEASVAHKSVGTAQGRGLALRQARMSLKNVPDAEFLRAATEKGLPVQQALQVLDEVHDPAGRLLALRKLSEPTAQDKIRQVIFTSLLSNPPTHAVNLLSSTASIIAREAMSFTSVPAVDAAVNAGARQVAIPPARIAAQAYWQGMKMGASTGWQMLTKGYDPSHLSDNIDRPLEAFTGKFTGPLMQMPTRMLGAADAFMAQPVYWAEVARRSTAKAMNEGVTGAALGPRIQQLMADHALDEELVAHVNRYVNTALFKQEPGKGTRWVGQGVKMLDDVGKHLPVPLPLGTMLIPFRQTPASILRQGFKASGGGLYTGYKAAQAGDTAQATRDTSEAVLGLGLIAALMMNLADDTIGVVGQLPTNELEREAAYKRGEKNWALRVGDRHVPAASLGPLATPVSIAAAYVEAFKRDPKAPAMDPFSRIVAPGLSSILDSSMLKAGSDFLESLRNPRAADRMTGRAVTMLIPYGGALRAVRDQVDPILREPGGKGATARFGSDASMLGKVKAAGRNVQEEVEAALPVLSKNVRPRIDTLGQPVQRPDPWDRVTGSTAEPDPVREELIRLKSSFPSWEDNGIYPGDMDAALTSSEGSFRKEMATSLKAAKAFTPERQAALESFLLSDEERDTYKLVVGGHINDVLSAVIANPVYQALPDEQKAVALRNERDRARKSGVEMFRNIVGADVENRLRGLVGQP
jgi:hypothetical protein